MQYDDELYDSAKTNINNAIFNIENIKNVIESIKNIAPSDWSKYYEFNSLITSINNIYNKLNDKIKEIEQKQQEILGQNSNFNLSSLDMKNFNDFNLLIVNKKNELDKLIYEREQLEKKLDKVKRSITNWLLSDDEKAENKKLINEINKYNELINTKKEEIFQLEMNKNFSDPEFNKKVELGKEISKKLDAKGSILQEMSDKEKVLTGDYLEQEVYDAYLTDEEKEMYYYILGSNNTYDSLGINHQGYIDGLEYLKVLEQKVHNQWGKELGEAQKEAYNNTNIIGKGFMTFCISAQQGLSSYFEGLNISTEKMMNKYLGFDNEIDTTITADTIAASDYRNNLGCVEGFFYDVNQTSTQMLPSVCVSQINPLIGTASIYASSYGSKYKEIINQGYSDYQASTYATNTATFETVSSQLLGGIEGIKFFKAPVAKTLSQIGLKYAGDMLQEGTEEVFQDTVTNWYANEFLGQNNNLDIFTKENAHTFLVSMGSAGYMNSIGTINEVIDVYNTGSNSTNSGTINRGAGESLIKNSFSDIFINIDKNIRDTKQNIKNTINKAKTNIGTNVLTKNLNNIIANPTVNNLLTSPMLPEMINLLSNNPTNFGLGGFAVLGTKLLGVKRKTTDISNSIDIKNTILNDGIVHITSSDAADAIINSKVVKGAESGEKQIINQGKKTFFFAGIPTFDEACVNVDITPTMVGVRIKPNESEIINFGYRNLDDNALIHNGDFDFSNSKSAEKIYLGLKLNEENNQLYYSEISKQEYDNYHLDFNNLQSKMIKNEFSKHIMQIISQIKISYNKIMNSENINISSNNETIFDTPIINENSESDNLMNSSRKTEIEQSTKKIEVNVPSLESISSKINASMKAIQKRVFTNINEIIDSINIDSLFDDTIDSKTIKLGNIEISNLTIEDANNIKEFMNTDRLTKEMFENGTCREQDIEALYLIVIGALRKTNDFNSIADNLFELKNELTKLYTDGNSSEIDRLNGTDKYMSDISDAIALDKKITMNILNLINIENLSKSSINDFDYSFSIDEKIKLSEIIRKTDTFKNLDIVGSLNLSDKLLLERFLKTGTAATLLTSNSTQIQSLFYYTSTNFDQINEYIDTGIDSNYANGVKCSEIVGGIKESMKNNKLDSTRIFQRQTTTKEFEGLSIKEVIGKTILSKRFKSTCATTLDTIGTSSGGSSYGHNVNGQKVKIDYVCPKGTECVSLGIMMGTDMMDEVLLGDNQKIKYISMTMDGDTPCVLALLLPDGIDENISIKELLDNDTFKLVDSKYELSDQFSDSQNVENNYIIISEEQIKVLLNNNEQLRKIIVNEKLDENSLYTLGDYENSILNYLSNPETLNSLLDPDILVTLLCNKNINNMLFETKVTKKLFEKYFLTNTSMFTYNILNNSDPKKIANNEFFLNIIMALPDKEFKEFIERYDYEDIYNNPLILERVMKNNLYDPNAFNSFGLKKYKDNELINRCLNNDTITDEETRIILKKLTYRSSNIDNDSRIKILKNFLKNNEYIEDFEFESILENINMSSDDIIDLFNNVDKYNLGNYSMNIRYALIGESILKYQYIIKSGLIDVNLYNESINEYAEKLLNKFILFNNDFEMITQLLNNVYKQRILDNPITALNDKNIRKIFEITYKEEYENKNETLKFFEVIESIKMDEIFQQKIQNELNNYKSITYNYSLNQKFIMDTQTLENIISIVSLNLDNNPDLYNQYGFLLNQLLEKKVKISDEKIQMFLTGWGYYFAKLNNISIKKINFETLPENTMGQTAGGNITLNIKHLGNYIKNLKTMIHEIWHNIQGVEQTDSTNISYYNYKQIIESLIRKKYSNEYYDDNYWNVSYEVDARCQAEIIVKNILESYAPNEAFILEAELIETINSELKRYNYNLSSIINNKQILTTDIIFEQLIQKDNSILDFNPILKIIYDKNGKKSIKELLDFRNILDENDSKIKLINQVIMNATYTTNEIITNLIAMEKYNPKSDDSNLQTFYDNEKIRVINSLYTEFINAFIRESNVDNYKLLLTTIESNIDDILANNPSEELNIYMNNIKNFCKTFGDNYSKIAMAAIVDKITNSTISVNTFLDFDNNIDFFNGISKQEYIDFIQNYLSNEQNVNNLSSKEIFICCLLDSSFINILITSENFTKAFIKNINNIELIASNIFSKVPDEEILKNRSLINTIKNLDQNQKNILIEKCPNLMEQVLNE